MKSKPMKAFKAWAVVDVNGDAVKLLKFRPIGMTVYNPRTNQVLPGGGFWYIPVEVRPLPKKPASRVKGKHGKA